MTKSKRLQNALFISTTCAMSIYLLWRLFFTLPFGEGAFALIMGILLLGSEIVAALGTFELFWRKTSGFKLELPEIPADWFPHVDVFIATHNEPVELLYNTVNACTFMDYPDKSKVHIYLCDDGNREEVARLAEQFGVGYLGLFGNKQAKSGNLNNALSKTDSPLVVTFDADMIPKHGFLMKSVPYFFLPRLKKTQEGKWVERPPEEMDPSYRIGFIQTPQNFYNPDLFQYNLFSEHNIPNEQDFFSKEINVMRNGWGGVAYTGSNTVLLRSALDEIGGFPTDTITEDFETGIKIQSLGYTTYATSEVLASGLTPTTVKSMISQRTRWARGVIQSVRNCRVPVNKDLSLSARISYLGSYSYWWSFARRIIFTLSPILFALFDVRVAVCGFWDLLIFWAPSHLLYSLVIREFSSETRNQRWAQIIDTILAPYLVIPVILETIGVRQRKFKVTRKNSAEKEREFSFPYAIPHLILLGLSIAALIRFAGGKYGMALFYSSFILYWLVYNAITLLHAVFFMWGRKIYRKSERMDAADPLRVSYDNRTLDAVTVNVSESGLSFALDRPAYIPWDRPVSFLLQNDHYRASFEGFIVYVRQAEDKWHYSVRISSMEEENKRQYMQLVYDRMPSLPTRLNLWITSFDDLNANLSKRLEKQVPEMRVLPRMQLCRRITFQDGSSALWVNFNYRYALLKGWTAHPDASRQYHYPLEKGLSLVLEPVSKHLRAGREGTLMRVVNWEELIYHPVFARLLDGFLKEYAEENCTQDMEEIEAGD